MKYAIAFILIGASLIVVGIRDGGWCYALIYPGASFVLVGIGYAGFGPGIFGKRDDGSMAAISISLLLPYLLFSWSVWYLRRVVTREAAAHEIAPGVWLGRRPYLRELPAGIALVVDMAAEFPAQRALRKSVVYVSLATLDTRTPDDDSFRQAVHLIVAEPRPVYVNCALGHGRSASLVAAVLIRKGIAPDVISAETIIRRIRPGVRLSNEQRQQVARVTENERLGHPD